MTTRIPGAVPTVHDVIDNAIRENRAGEALLYSFAAIFVLLGGFVIVWSIAHSAPAEGVVGLAASVLFLPAMKSGTQMRKENLMIRLMEVPLTRAETADEAAKIVTQMFQQSLQGSVESKLNKSAGAST